MLSCSGQPAKLAMKSKLPKAANIQLQQQLMTAALTAIAPMSFLSEFSKLKSSATALFAKEKALN
jgi:hypothetical protein